MYDAFIEKLTSPFTNVDELRECFMKPIPPKIGQVKMTIERHKGGFNRFWPKYSLTLSDGNKFLLKGKKRSGNATSNYMICMDEDKASKSVGYLGKVRSNFLGTEFNIFDNMKNPSKAKLPDEIRACHGVVQYETNVLGSKGPRRMKVLLPNVLGNGDQIVWKAATVSLVTFYLILL